MPVLVLVLLVVVAAVGGVIAYGAILTVRATTAQAISTFATLAAILDVVLYVEPRVKELYFGFGVELPGLTVWASKVVDPVRTYFPYLLPNLVGSSLIGAVLFYLAHRDPEIRGKAKMWSLVATIFFSTSISLHLVLLLLPLPKLMNDLS